MVALANFLVIHRLEVAIKLVGNRISPTAALYPLGSSRYQSNVSLEGNQLAVGTCDSTAKRENSLYRSRFVQIVPTTY